MSVSFLVGEASGGLRESQSNDNGGDDLNRYAGETGIAKGFTECRDEAGRGGGKSENLHLKNSPQQVLPDTVQATSWPVNCTSKPPSRPMAGARTS